MAGRRKKAMTNPVPAVPEWVTKEEACAMLGVGRRQVERREQMGMIQKRILPRKPQERYSKVLYSAADIRAILAGVPNSYSRIDPVHETRRRAEQRREEHSAQALAHPQQALMPAGDPVGAGLALVLRTALEHIQPAANAAPPVVLPPWITLAQAVEVSGLTRRWLLDAVEAGAPWVRDMGPHARGGRWRFHRESLAQASL